MELRAVASRLRLGEGPLLDAALVAAVLAGSLTMLTHGGIDAIRSGPAPADDDLTLVGVTLVLCATLPLLCWRRLPLGAFVTTSAASVLLTGLGYPVDLLLGPTAALYLLATGPRWNRRAALAGTGLLVAYVATVVASTGTFPALGLLHNGLAWAVAWFAGERTRLRREHLADLRHRAARAERDAERERLLAAAEERARIARDLHDSAGHAISVIAVRAGAARLSPAHDPDRSLAALRAIEDLARQTVDEINNIVTTLRGGTGRSGVVEPPCGLASVDTLVADHAAAGHRAAIQTVGSPRALNAAADQAAYRILQEALTNAARHGAGDTTVTLTFADAGLDLTVTNPVGANGAARVGGGHGLIGMRERAALLGGTVSTQRRDGTFQLRAWIPYGQRR
jgi:signal transduction histidine kinase